MIVLFVFLAVVAFDVVRAFKKNEKKEAIIHIVLTVLVIPMALYVSLEPKFVSFAEVVHRLLGIK